MQALAKTLDDLTDCQMLRSLLLLLTSPLIKRVFPRLKAFSFPSSLTSICCRQPSATFHVTVK